MITKLSHSLFDGYDEYLLEDLSRIYHDKASGEDIWSELREVPVGSLIITPKQQAAHQAYKERGQKIAAQKRELGKHIFIDVNNDAFCDLSADTLARAAYLSSFVCFGTDELWRTRYTKLARKDLPDVMKLSKRTADRFWGDVKDRYFYRDDDGFLHTAGHSFIKGKLNVPCIDEYQKLYIAALRELYEKVPVTQHKRIGFVLKMLRYLNFEYNILCYNPTEKDKDEIVPMTVLDFCNMIGLKDETHIYRLPREYGKLRFTVNGKEEVFCKFLSNGNDIALASIYINPRLVYKGTDYRKIAAIGISFAADAKPVVREGSQI